MPVYDIDEDRGDRRGRRRRDRHDQPDVPYRPTEPRRDPPERAAVPEAPPRGWNVGEPTDPSAIVELPDGRWAFRGLGDDPRSGWSWRTRSTHATREDAVEAFLDWLSEARLAYEATLRSARADGAPR